MGGFGSTAPSGGLQGGYENTGASRGLGGGGGLRTPGAACRTASGEEGTWQLGANRGWQCVAAPKAAPASFFSTGTGTAAGGGAVPTPQRPTAPALPPTPTAPTVSAPREIGASVPELQRLGGNYEQHLRNLESGTGYAMDVTTGAQRNTTEAQIKQAREARAAQGIPFNEAAMRAELSRGIYGAQAQEKINREKLLTDAYGQAPSVIGADEAARQGRWEIGQKGDIAKTAADAAIYSTQAGIRNADVGAGTSRYGIDAGMYSTEVNAANSANQALLDFLSKLWSGAWNSMSGGFSQNYTYGG